MRIWKGSRRLLLAIAVAGSVNLVGAVSALANNPVLGGQVICSLGQEVVTWTVTNSEFALASGGTGRTMKITALSVSQGTVSGIAVGDVLQPQPLAGSTETGTTTLPANTTGSVTLTVTGHFYNPDNSDSGIVDTQSTTVTFSGTYMQGAYAVPQTSQTTVPVSYPNAQGAGDLNVVLVGWNDTTASISSVTDSAVNNYQVAVPTGQGNGLSQAIYYAKNIVASAANTVTVTFSSGAAYPDIRILEYANVDTTSPFDVGATNSGTASLASSGSATTTTAPELLIGAGMTGGLFSAAGSGYTSRIITNPDGDIAEDQVVTSSGSYSATAPVNGAWLMQLAAFKGGSCGTGTPTQTIAGHIYDCTGGVATTTEVSGGMLGATGPQTVPSQGNPLNPTSVAAGGYTMSASSPSGYQFVQCGSTATISSPSAATESVNVPAGGAGVGIFYVAKVPTSNPCAGIFTPGYWKNYQNHFTTAQFQSFIDATLNFGTGPGGAHLSVSQAVTILKRTGNDFERSLLTAELNVSALPSLGGDVYAGNSQTIATVLKQAYIDDGGTADNGSPTAAEQSLVAYLSGGGENVSASACQVHPQP